ncbi:MAG: HutD family protein [Bacteroidia bacterium]
MKVYNSFETNTWSGGSTTELFISPKLAQFADRNFHFRLSTATIETEESTYTPLPNIDRHFMVIGGSIALSHNSGLYKQINQFEQDHFGGSCLTKSRGKTQAFNLMLMNGCKGELKHEHLIEGRELLIEKDKSKTQRFMFLVSGQLEVRNPSNAEVCLLNAKELLEIQLDSVIINATDDSDFVIVEINCA